MWPTIFIAAYVLIALMIVISLLLHGAKPSKTLAWLLAIFTIPVGGILLYLLLGRNRRKQKLLKLGKPLSIAQPKVYTPEEISTANSYIKLQKLVHTNCGFPVTDDNELYLLKNGKMTFDAIFEALNGAQKRIHIQYYIFEDGELAERLLQLFTKKIAHGVKIRMIYDGVGSFSLSKKYLKNLLEIGVDVYPFLPFKFGRFLRSINYRNHRKIITVDGRIGFTGGINISDKYLKGDPTLGNWNDMHLRIKGTAAMHLDYVFTTDWYLVSQEKIALLPLANTLLNGKGKRVQIVSSGPDDDFPSVKQAYFSIINTASEYLYITNPYIIPNAPMLQALQTLALSGVDVRIMISEKTDSTIVGWCVRSYFEAFLRAGVKIYLFPDGFLHSKIMISDDAIVSIGTANLDDRSFDQNYEVNAIVYDKAFAKLLKDDFLQDSEICSVLTYAEYLKRPWPDKLKEGFGKVFSPVL
ncbi:cardiolipin synthase [Maribacter chungangensis]|uniref:Cardiolipin synthase n=1 Tax=Maribacter chungangensis TaxID=1069117 RepID=A0ABW3B5X4_9FLAO